MTTQALAAPAPPEVAPPATALSAEHAKMLTLSLSEGRPPTPSELHAQLATQLRDPEWSFAKELAIRQALAAANASGELDIVTVDCRASLCEVLAFGNLPTSLQLWNRIWGESSTQPWFADLSVNASAVQAMHGRETFATFLQRSNR